MKIIVSVKKVQLGSRLTMSSRHSKSVILETIAFTFFYENKKYANYQYF